MRGERKIHFGIRKYAVGVVSVALSIGFVVTNSATVQAAELSSEEVSIQQVSNVEESQASLSATPTLVENSSQDPVPVEQSLEGQTVPTPVAVTSAEQPIAEAGLDEVEVAVSQGMSEAPVLPDQAITESPVGLDQTDNISEEVPTPEAVPVSQPQFRSRMARSVADQTVIASLPLDANGELVTSLSQQTVTQVQEVYADGTSQVEAATTANTPTIKNSQNVADLVTAVSSDLKAVTYESLYDGLNHTERFLDGLAIAQELKREKNGQEPTAEELANRKRQVYMDQLDMRENFGTVQTNLDTILTGVFEKSTAVDTATVKANKEKILLGLTYLDRQYGFQFGNLAAKDLILYYPEVFGSQTDVLNNLISIGTQTYADLELKNNLTTYQKKIAPITKQADLVQFIESQVPRWVSGQDVETWFKETSKAHIVESTSPNGNSSLYQQLKADSPRLVSHILPLLTLSSDSVLALATTDTITYGLRDTYLPAGTATDTLQASLDKTVQSQQEFIDVWYRISEKSDTLRTHPTVVVVDSLQALGQANESARSLWSAKTGNKALPGVRQFITPMGLYSNFLQAGGQKDSDTRITFFLGKALTDNGLSVYTHEMTHIFDNKVWFNGYGRRTNKDAELYATGLFDSHNNTQGQSSYAPIFNLNTAYELGANRTQNQSPRRFQTEADLKEYMQGLLDVVYSLDYLEAKVSLEKSAADKAVLFNQLSYSPSPTNPLKIQDEFRAISEEVAASLTSVDDLVDNAMVSGRLAFKGFETRGVANHNDYFVVPLFEPVYAGLQNNSSFVGDFTMRRYAYELLGEYGYKDGMVAYLSNQYVNDQAALAAIMPEHNGDLATFKKAMYARRAERLADLKTTSQFTDLADLETKMRQAVEQDLAKMKTNQANNTYLTTGVTAVRSLKTQIFQEYLAMTNDFQSSIYKEKDASRTFYVTNGLESSTEGAGTEANPYHSLSYALQQASDGDVIKLVRNVTHRQDAPFIISKAVTIDGQGHTLTFRGPDLELGAAVTFTNMTLNMIPSGSHQPTIYLNGYQATFDAVSTTVNQLQDKLRPTIVAGARTGQATGDHARLLVVNGDSNTRFRQIFAGNADSSSSIPVTITIDSEFAGVDEGIDLGGQNDQVTYGRVELISRSTKVKEVVASNSMDNQVTINAARIYGANFLDMQELTLAENAAVTLDRQVERISGLVTIGAGSQLQLDNGTALQIGDLAGQGKLVIPAGSRLEVLADVTGPLQIELTGFESQLAPVVDQVFLTVEGLLDPTSSVSLANHFNRFAIVQENGHYRLVSRDQQPQTHTLTLRFIQAGQVLKSEQVQVVDGQSLANVKAYLPQAVKGTYQLAPGFDPSVLTGISASQTIDIPVVLVIPTTPILSFDKTSIQEMTLVQGLDKSRYQEGEILDLTGVRVRLVDQQGIALVIDATRFTEYGVSANPVGTPLLSSQQELTLTLGNHILSLPIQVQAQLPSKASRFQPLTLGEAQSWPSDSEQVKEEQVLQLISLPNEAGSVELEVVGTLPSASGDYRVIVRVTYDDQSHEEVHVPLHILSINMGSGVTHELLEGVLPPLETAKGTGVTHELPASVLPPLETAKGTGLTHELPEGILSPLETAKGTGLTHELPEGILPPLETAKGSGLTHELPEGVLPPLETDKGSGLTHELPEGILPPLETAKGTGLTHELPEGILPPLETVKGSGLTHELPEGVLPPLETAKGTGVTHELSEGVLPPLETAKGTGLTHELPSGVLPPLETDKGSGLTHELPAGILPPLETAKGTGVTHELPASVLPPLETAKGTGLTHELPEGVLPPLETAKGTGLTHELLEAVLPPLETAKGTGLTHELSEGVLSPLDSVSTAQPLAKRKEARARISQSSVQAKLPATGQKVSLYLFSLGLGALASLFILHKGKRSSKK
ncbi:ZmpA/ZmpB/ZmpC family metallo-endopeptidase [Streptococcus suis]|uniref:ZmpA/ZmpB/ZmpC family metallo-endopeptidase n=1 Tax=Streptococcus suis TaxID=1307 RepID=UPI001ABE4FD5|nr:YSIRK-type signal peptide-containing protein [Streptococcus suis]